MLQQTKPEDFIIATIKQHRLRDFLNIVIEELDLKVEWSGKGPQEVGRLNGKEITKIDPRYFFLTEAYTLLGDAIKIGNKLNWTLKILFKEIVSEIVSKDLKSAKQELLFR